MASPQCKYYEPLVVVKNVTTWFLSPVNSRPGAMLDKMLLFSALGLRAQATCWGKKREVRGEERAEEERMCMVQMLMGVMQCWVAMNIALKSVWSLWDEGTPSVVRHRTVRAKPQQREDRDQGVTWPIIVKENHKQIQSNCAPLNDNPTQSACTPRVMEHWTMNRSMEQAAIGGCLAQEDGNRLKTLLLLLEGVERSRWQAPAISLWTPGIWNTCRSMPQLRNCQCQQQPELTSSEMQVVLRVSWRAGQCLWTQQGSPGQAMGWYLLRMAIWGWITVDMWEQIGPYVRAKETDAIRVEEMVCQHFWWPIRLLLLAEDSKVKQPNKPIKVL